MFRAFIVDDDKSAVQITEFLFPWEELQVDTIEKIYTADGLTDRIVSEKPDIVFIDIELDTAFGLDIVKECIEKGSNSLFIIISGHDNFKYAQAATNIGVVYYLLKRLDPAEIFTVTQKLKKRLFIQEKDDISNYLSSEPELKTFFSRYITSDSTYRMMITNVTDGELTEVNQLLQKAVEGMFKIGQKKYLFILNADTYNKNTQLLLTNYTVNKPLLFCIGSEFSLDDNIKSCFHQTNILSYQNFLYPKRGILMCKKHNITPLKNLITALTNNIEKFRINIVTATLEKIPILFAEHQYTIEHVVSLYNTIAIRIGILDAYKNYPFPFPQMNEEDLQMNFRNLEHLCSSLIEYFEEIQTNEGTISDSAKIWADMCEFIEKNYSKKIQAQDVCTHFFISPKTMHNIFKTNTDETFIEYLTHVRIEKAKQLLLDTKMPLTEIAEAVGIRDYYYFNKIFKRLVGVTPTRYRSQYNEGGVQ